MKNPIGITYRPIPIRGCSFEAALFDERILEKLDIISVPWQEHPGPVDLLIGLRTPRAQRTSDVR
jgi:hypothetical protein